MLQAVINKSHWCVAVCAVNCTVDCRNCFSHCSSHWSDSQTLGENRDLCPLHLHSTPLLGRASSEYCHNAWYGKTRMVWLATVKKLQICLLVSTQSTNVTNSQTDRRMDRHRTTAYAAIMHSIARQKPLDCLPTCLRVCSILCIRKGLIFKD